jgi:Ca2+-binding EF-hand superfamily protein
MSRGFQAMDRNGDGVIETDELPGGRGKRITLKEYQDNLRRQFHKLDRNRDDYLNASELTAPPR